MDDIRKLAYAALDQSDVIKEVLSEYDPVSVDSSGPDPDIDTVEEPEPSETARFLFELQSEIPEGEDETGTLGRMREIAYSRKNNVTFNQNDGVAMEDEIAALTEKAKQLATANAGLSERGIKRRYIMAEPEAPTDAHVYEDGVGKYFYKTDTKIRPSDVTAVVDADSWFALSDDGRTLASVLLLAKEYPWFTVEEQSREQIESHLYRALVTELDELNDENVYRMERIDKIANVLANR
jgi:hypothetical protein